MRTPVEIWTSIRDGQILSRVANPNPHRQPGCPIHPAHLAGWMGPTTPSTDLALRTQSSAARSSPYVPDPCPLPSSPQISPPSQNPTKQTTITARKSGQRCRELFPKSSQWSKPSRGQIPSKKTPEKSSRPPPRAETPKNATKVHKSAQKHQVTTQ